MDHAPEYERSKPGFGTRLLYKIVRNDAMKEDPPEIYGWRVFMLACSACFGGMLFGFDIGTIGGVLVMDSFKARYKMTDQYMNKQQRADLTANITSTLQAGCFAGCFLASWMADRLGRKKTLMFNGIVALIGCIMQAVAEGQMSVIYIGRFIAGVGVGGASTVTPFYISENAPRGIRGGLTGLYQLFITMGIMLAFWCNYGSLLHINGKGQYIVPLAMQGLPGILLATTMMLNKESPRQLAKTDKWDEAIATLSRVRGLPPTHPYVQAELDDMAAQLKHERELVGGSSTKDLLKEMWTIPGNRKRALISIGLMICQQMTGTNAINYYAPQIFINLGLRGTSTNLFATGIYGVCKVVACFVFLVFFVDSLGRRKSLLWTSIAQGALMFYIGIFVRIDTPAEGKPVPPAGYVALVCIFLFACTFQFGWGPVPWVYVSEIPTSRLRSMNVAMGAATQWLFNFVVARATPNMLVTVGKGGYGAFLIYGSFCFSMFFFAWFFVPETKGVSLERMDELFGVTYRRDPSTTHNKETSVLHDLDSKSDDSNKTPKGNTINVVPSK